MAAYNSESVMTVADTYDALAGVYHLIFENWDASIRRQAGVLVKLLRDNWSIGPGARILDCACGIGTQVIGLAQTGFEVTGSDISPAAIARARQETTRRGLQVPLYVADMLDLKAVNAPTFDAVICMDNSISHLTDEQQVLSAAAQMRSKLRNGGALIVSIRDYDRLLVEKSTSQGPFFFTDPDGGRRIVFQVWDWRDDRQYMFHLFIVRSRGPEWETFHTTGLYRAIRRDELSELLTRAGFRDIRWLSPSETDYYQPIVIATAG